MEARILTAAQRIEKLNKNKHHCSKKSILNVKNHPTTTCEQFQKKCENNLTENTW